MVARNSSGFFSPDTDETLDGILRRFQKTADLLHAMSNQGSSPDNKKAAESIKPVEEAVSSLRASQNSFHSFKARLPVESNKSSISEEVTKPNLAMQSP